MDIIQWVGEVIIATLKHGWSVTTFLVALTALLRVRTVRAKLKKHFPMLFSNDSEVKEYVENQRIIMENQRRILSYMGVEVCGALETGINGRTSLKESSNSSRTVKSELLHLNKSMGVSHKKKKLLSRKFLLSVVSAVLIILNDGLDLGIDSDTVLAFAGLIATYILGESAVDIAKKPKNETNPDLSDME
jgi:hypothetical protein